MRTHNQHLADENILLFIDRELSARQMMKTRDHLDACQLCRERRMRLETTLADFDRIHQEKIDAQRATHLSARALMKGWLANASLPTRRTGSSLFLGSPVIRQLACASIALMIVAGSVWAIRAMLLQGRRPGSPAENLELAMSLPRRQFTPGATRAVEVEQLCREQEIENDPAVNPSVEQAVFKEYGVPASAKGAYELDYLIAPALGGGDSIRNLWPQPYSSTWNARVKDQLEDHLHDLVCQGKVQLTVAQGEIASDWISAYKKYFNADRPQPSAVSSAAAARPDDIDGNDGTDLGSQASAISGSVLVASLRRPLR